MLINSCEREPANFGCEIVADGGCAYGSVDTENERKIEICTTRYKDFIHF